MLIVILNYIVLSRFGKHNKGFGMSSSSSSDGQHVSFVPCSILTMLFYCSSIFSLFIFTSTLCRVLFCEGGTI